MPVRWPYSVRVLPAALGTALIVAGTGGTEAAPPVPGSKYVAMGSSFAAGPGVLQRAPGSPAGCGRSAYNYAHLIARKYQLALTDVSCSGATTLDILSHRQFGLPPEIEAVDASTRLVTITIGGNDVSYMANVIAASCLTSGGDAIRCHPVQEAEVERVFTQLEDRMNAVVSQTRTRAPEARILLVDYFTIVPHDGQCAPLLPLTPAQIETARSVAHRLQKITAHVARANRVQLVKLSEASADHDVCARNPWIVGYAPTSASPDFRMPPYHPNAEGMAGAAAKIEESLAEDG